MKSHLFFGRRSDGFKPIAIFRPSLSTPKRRIRSCCEGLDAPPLPLPLLPPQLETARATIGVSSVMFARSAMWNASVFAQSPVHKLQVPPASQMDRD